MKHHISISFITITIFFTIISCTPLNLDNINAGTDPIFTKLNGFLGSYDSTMINNFKIKITKNDIEFDFSKIKNEFQKDLPEDAAIKIPFLATMKKIDPGARWKIILPAHNTIQLVFYPTKEAEAEAEAEADKPKAPETILSDAVAATENSLSAGAKQLFEFFIDDRQPELLSFYLLPEFKYNTSTTMTIKKNAGFIYIKTFTTEDTIPEVDWLEFEVPAPTT